MPASNCYDDPIYNEAKVNIDWVFQNSGALANFRKARNGNKARFEAVLEAQSGNPNAQRTIREMGDACVTKYILDVHGSV